MTQGLVENLKNSNVILEGELVELNQNNNLIQPDQTDAVLKLYFTFEMTIGHLAELFTRVLQNR